jgi:hypothetical protein
MDQAHPLYDQDRAIANRLLRTTLPSDSDAVDCARLLIRYDSFPGAYDIQHDLLGCLETWDMSREQLHDTCRMIWARGYRPDLDTASEVGSGADVNAS